MHIQQIYVRGYRMFAIQTVIDSFRSQLVGKERGRALHGAVAAGGGTKPIYSLDLLSTVLLVPRPPVRWSKLSSKSRQRRLSTMESTFQLGAPEGIRTPNLLIRSQMLYPLSYGRLSSIVSRGGGERI